MPRKPVNQVAMPAGDAAAVQRAVLSLAEIGRNPRLIPADWDSQAELIETAVTMGRRLVLVMAMLVARARETFADPSAWLAECERRWGWTRAYIHHLRAVGDLLCRVSRGDTHGVLFALSWEHVYSISRLPEHLVSPFLEKARPETLTRDECRLAVNRWLAAAGEPTDGGGWASGRHARRHEEQPDFLETLFAAASDDRLRDRLVSDPTPPRRAAMAGLALVDVAVRKYAAGDPDPGDLEAMLEDLQRTSSSVRDLLASTTRRQLGLPTRISPALDEQETF